MNNLLSKIPLKLIGTAFITAGYSFITAFVSNSENKKVIKDIAKQTAEEIKNELKNN